MGLVPSSMRKSYRARAARLERMERRWASRIARWAVVVALALIMILALTIVTVYANGAPIEVFLDYIPGISNWGPQRATGRAVVALGDGEVTLEVNGLPRLVGEQYQVWMEREDTREWVPVGTFNSDENGVGKLYVISDEIPYTTYRLMVITVEPAPDPDPEPSGKVSLIGRFPNLEISREALLRPAGGGGAGEGAGDEEMPPPPPFLPVTGGEAPHPFDRWSRVWPILWVLVAELVILAWYQARRRRDVGGRR